MNYVCKFFEATLREKNFQDSLQRDIEIVLVVPAGRESRVPRFGRFQMVGRLLSYYLGCAMGRWDLELDPDDNGIIVFDSDFEDDVMSYICRCIELTYGEEELFERETDSSVIWLNSVQLSGLR